jgi:hypothetical protein
MNLLWLLPDAIGTTCGQRLEKVLGTELCHILRVPFRTEWNCSEADLAF